MPLLRDGDLLSRNIDNYEMNQIARGSGLKMHKRHHKTKKHIEALHR